MQGQPARVGLVAVILGSLCLAAPAGAQTLLGSVNIGSQPVADMEVDPATSRIYVGSGIGQTTGQVLDAGNPAAPVPMATFSGSGIALDPAGGRFHASSGLGGTVLSYDLATNGAVGSPPFIGFCGGSLEFDQGTGLLYMVSQCGGGNDPLHVLNTGTTLSVAAGPLGTGGVVESVHVNPASGKAYVNASGTIVQFGPAPSFTNLGTLSAGRLLEVDPSHDQLFRRNASGTLDILAGSSHAVLHTVPTTNAAGVAAQAAANRIFIADAGTNNIEIVDALSFSSLGSFTLGAGVVPGIMTLDPVNERLYVQNDSGGINTIYVVDVQAFVFTLQITEPVPGAMDLVVTNATPGVTLFTLVSLTPLAPGGSGPFFGLAPDAFFNFQTFPQVPPFVTLPDAAGAYAFSLPGGMLQPGTTLQSRALQPVTTGGSITSVDLSTIQTITF